MNRPRQVHVRRRIVVAAIVPVVTAVLVVAMRPRPEIPVGDDGAGKDPAAATAPQPVAPVPTLEPIVEPAAGASPQVVTIGVRGAVTLDPIKVIVLPARADNPDPAAVRSAETVRQAMLRSLRGVAVLDIVDLSAAEFAAVVPPGAGSRSGDNLVYLAVMSRYQGRLVAEVSEQSSAGSRVASSPEMQFWSIGLLVRRPNGSGAINGIVGRNGDPGFGTDPESLGVRFAQRIMQSATEVGPTSAAMRNEQAILLDATRPEQERLQSLGALINDGVVLGPEEIAAAMDLATQSELASTRRTLWMQLGQSAYDPALAQHLGYALLTDPDVGVRRVVALALANYRGDSAARATLEHVSHNDSSFEVRLTAQMAAMSPEEQRAFMRQRLLDESLTPLERLAPTTVVGIETMPLLSQPYGAAQAEEALAAARIVVATDDPAVKASALSVLQRTLAGTRIVSLTQGPSQNRNQSIDPQIVRVLIDSAQHEDVNVRRLALNTLMQQRTDDPDVRAVLDSALENEPELAAQIGISRTGAPLPVVNVLIDGPQTPTSVPGR